MAFKIKKRTIGKILRRSKKKKPKKRKASSKKELKLTEIRKVGKKRPNAAKEYLTLALEEIRREELKLRNMIEKIEQTVSTVDTKIAKTHTREDRLRDRLSKLIALESKINIKKSKLKSELDKINTRLRKIGKIEEDIKEASID